MEDMITKDKPDVVHASMANGCSNGEGIHFGHGESANSCNNSDDVGTSIDGTGEFNAKGSRFEKASDIHKTDGLQELLQIAQEFESDELSQGGSNEKSHSLKKGFVEGNVPEQKVMSSSIVKDEASIHKEGMQGSWSEEARLTSGALIKEVSASFSLSDAKSEMKADQKSFENREELDCGQVHASVNRRRSKTASSASITVGPSRSQFTIPQPFSLATDKRALGAGRPRDAENGLSQKALRSNGNPGYSCSRTPEISKRLGPRLHVQKSVCSESIKHQEDNLKKLSICETPEQHDEDAMSISSITSWSLAPKAKESRFTSARSFKFQSDVRAEKRKEYYTKLQARLNAKEEEINSLIAKAQKEREEEIKLLRRSLTFKAHPVPNFYQVGPPQKVELPKTPTTRAKSPNFTRRETSFGGRLCHIIKCEGDHRCSFSPQKSGNGCNLELLGDYHSKMSLERKFLPNSPEKKLAEVNTPSSASVSELLDLEFSVADIDSAEMHVKVRDPLIISSEMMMSDDEEKVAPAQMIESKHANCNGRNEIYHDEVTFMKPSRTAAVIDSCERLDCRVRAGGVLQGQGNANAGSSQSTCNNAKAGKKAQPLVHKNSDDFRAKEGSQSTRRQRNKASTPYFPKRERRDEEQAAHGHCVMTVGSE
ncbi:hypothetical protein L7F22_036631 [Adiantum nelumboides]|nr:hypothetical protein [Adiantum nelumboides]